MANKKPKNTKNTKAKTAKKTNEQIAVEGAVSAAKNCIRKIRNCLSQSLRLW